MSNNAPEELIKRIRLEFEAPNQSKRPLLLAFIPNNQATDDFDYGYDAENIDDFPSDLNWTINEKECVIQGVGEFDITKQYPLKMVISTTGNAKISLTDLENFDEDINVYIYDSLLETYHLINAIDFELPLDTGVYENRFFVVFEDLSSPLDIEDFNLKDLRIYYLNDASEIYINWNQINEVKEVELINHQENIGFSRATLRTLNKLNLMVTTSFYFCRIVNHNILNGSF